MFLLPNKCLSVFSILSVFSFLASSAEVVLHYEFNGANGVTASNAANSGTSQNTDSLDNAYGSMDGSGQLIVSQNSGRKNTSLGSDGFGGTVFYRIDFNIWDTSGTNVQTKFGFRLRSGETDTTPSNKFFDVALSTGTGSFSANLNTSASGSYDFVQGGMANPNTQGVSFILGVDTVADTFSIWWDNQLTGTYSILRDSIALNLGGETDFTQVNALTFTPGGGTFAVERIALGTDYAEIVAISGGSGDISGGGDNGSGSIGDGMNVLLIVCDDLNDFESVFGGHPQVQTPHMDALAAESVQFVNAHTNAPICGPSRSSFLTGIYPHSSGVYGFDNWYNPGRSDTFSVNTVMQNSKTLMHYMRDNGYKSYGAGKLLHQDVDDDYVYPTGHPEAGNPQEFWDEYGLPAWAGPFAFNQISGESVNHPKIPQTFYEGAGALNSLFGSLADVPEVNGQTGWWNATWSSSGAYRYVNETDRDDMQDEKVRKWAVDKINELAAVDPTGENEHFIMSIGFHNPHTPFIAPQEYFDKYPLETLQLTPRIAGDVEDTYFDKNVKITQSTLHVYQSLIDSIGEASEDGTVYSSEEDFLKAYLQAYLACVSFVDTQIGALVAALDASPYADNTIVILTSDHGYEWGEKEALSKNTLWENSTRVPLLIRVPGLEANNGKQVDLPVSLIDLYPTIKDLCGLDADTKKTSLGVDLDGHSLRPLLLNPENGTWSGPPVALSMVSSRMGDIPGNKNFAVRSREWRYIRYENGMEELYNHADDPYEFTNLITSSDPAVVEKYKQLSGELLSMVPELSTDRRNLIIDPSFEWLPDVTSPDAGEEMWLVEESSTNVWQVTRENSYMYSYGKYSLKFNQRWTSFPVKQLLTDPLDTNLTYALSFWMRRDSIQFSEPGINDALISVELWTCSTVDGTYQNRASWVTGVENTQSDVWQQFTGVIDASTLGDYNGQFAELRIVRNDNVKQRIYLDEFVLNAYTANSFAHWAHEKGLNPYISALDLDGDGLSCLQEYVFGGDPINRDSIGFTPELTKVEGGVRYAYPERKNSGLSYQVEHSTDLLNWQVSGFTEQPHDASFDSDFWKSIGEINSEEDALFVRLKATLPSIEAGSTAALYTPSWLYIGQ